MAQNTFRFELILYAQVIGALLLYSQYEANAVSNPKKIKNLQDFMLFNNTPQQLCYIYFPSIVGLAILTSLFRFLFQTTIIDLFIAGLTGATAFWAWYFLLPVEKIFITSDQHLTALILNHHALAALVVTLFVFVLLASRVDYRKDAVELLPLHVLAGLLVVDVSVDLPLLLPAFFPPPADHLKLHLAHVTSGVGGIIIEIVVPAVIGFVGLLILYRILNRWWTDILVLLLFGATGAVFALYVVPLEKNLAKSKTTNREAQEHLAYAHIAFLALIFVATIIKLIQTHSNAPPPPATTSASASTTSATKASETPKDAKVNNKATTNSPKKVTGAGGGAGHGAGHGGKSSKKEKN